jgi:hypothetical protein
VKGILIRSALWGGGNCIMGFVGFTPVRHASDRRPYAIVSLKQREQG